jgi:DNA replication protein DnaC
MQEIVYNIIDSRYRAGLPMIITTNLTSEELKNPQEITNKRIYDRVLERCLPVEVKGKNRRHSKLTESFGELNDLLGL